MALMPALGDSGSTRPGPVHELALVLDHGVLDLDVDEGTEFLADSTRGFCHTQMCAERC